MHQTTRLLALFVLSSGIMLSHSAAAQDKEEASPKVVSAVAPVYAALIHALNIEGDFRVDVVVDRKGKVISSKLWDDRYKFMRHVLEGAADRWRFEPDPTAEKKRRVRLTFTFRLTPEESSLDSTPIFYPPYRIEVRDNSVLVSTPSIDPG